MRWELKLEDAWVNMGVMKGGSVRFVPAPRKLWNELLPTNPLLIKLYAAGGRLLPRGSLQKLANHILTTRGHRISVCTGKELFWSIIGVNVLQTR